MPIGRRLMLALALVGMMLSVGVAAYTVVLAIAPTETLVMPTSVTATSSNQCWSHRLTRAA
jgi:hypothetical protein